ncbi:MAG: insulinase family protein [Muribaculaceae bacterium]|nr:insulinase family protein [Muribaculaceae bacterium]
MLDRTIAPKVKPFGLLNIPDENTITLANGLTLHTLSGGDQDVMRLNIIAEGGTSECKNQCEASFAAELLREGNSTLDSEQIADIVDYNGAWFNSSASSHFTTLQISGLTSKLDVLAPVMIDCLVNPTLPQNAFEIIRSKGVALQRLNLSKVSFLANADNRRLIAGAKHPESRVPSPEEIENIKLESLVDFHKKIVNAAHIHAYLCGRFSQDDLNRLCRHLELIPASDAPSPLNIVQYESLPPCTSEIDKPGSLQSAVVMSLPAVPRNHPDYNALRMTVTALGGYFGSRLMMNIREDKGYTYGISSALLGARDGSYITISAQCDNRYTRALIEEVKHELLRMVSEPLSSDELSRLKFNLASDLASTLDSPMTMMDYYELRRTVGIPDDYFEARQKTLAAISPGIVCEMAARYLRPELLRISIAGDLSSVR